MQMQSISGIITQIHSTVEEVPPALVGASVNVIDDKVYVFGGRLATSRKMTNYLYILDLATLVWSRHIPPPDSDKPPKARYFHSASVYKKQLIIFGGMGYSRISSEGLCVLDDVAVLDIETMCWSKPNIQPSLYSPQSRYAHLSSISDDKLIVIGGQDLENNYLDEMNVLNLKTWDWEQVKTFEKHVGAYRSIAVTGPQNDANRMTPSASNSSFMKNSNNDQENTQVADDSHEDNEITTNGHRTSAVRQFGPNSINNSQQQQQQQQQRADEPKPIYLYTNYNFADVKRELQLIYPTAAHIEDCSNYMTGSIMPPGLRFPTGHTLGNHLILAGTYLSPQSQSFTIWSLDLGKLTWSRIETGTVFNSGSWNRGVLYENGNRFLVFGNQHRNLLEDYNHRQVNFEHLAMVDLEAFGVYALPKVTCSSLAQEMGLRLLNEPAVSDFHIITQDQLSIPVNSAVLCQRWPYFANLMKYNHETVVKTSQPNSKRSSQLVPEAIVITPTAAIVEEKEEEEEEASANGIKEKEEQQEVETASISSSIASATSSIPEEEQPKEEEEKEEKIKEQATEEKEEEEAQIINVQPAAKEEEQPEQQEDSVTLIKSHFMSFPYPHTVVIALLQFIYTDNLLTAQQYQPHILSQLLLLSDMYDIPRLRELATHALHQMLNMSTAPLIFETAALSHQTSLQIRALKMMIAAKKMIQQQQQLQQQQLQQQQQQQQRTRTVSTPVGGGAGEGIVSPTASLSSSSFSNVGEQQQRLPSAAGSQFEYATSPTLQHSFRSSPSTSRKASLNRSTYNGTAATRSSTFSSVYSNSAAATGGQTRNTYNSPPTTPRQQRSYPTSEIDLPTTTSTSSTTRRSSSPPPKFMAMSTTTEGGKKSTSGGGGEKKKKKAFLEAFGKFSSFSNNNKS